MDHRSFVRAGAAALTLVFLPLVCVAQEAPTIYSNIDKMMRSGEEVKAYGNDLFGDKINYSSGSVEFIQTDVSLPGNNKLPVTVGRRFVPGNQQGPQGLFADWELEIPHIHGVFAAVGRVGDQRVAGVSAACSNLVAPPQRAYQGGTFNPDEYWYGTSAYIPGMGDEEILLRDSRNANFPSDGNNWTFTTRSLWAVRCGTTGLIVVTPDGTRYQFDWTVSRSFENLTKWSPAPASARTPGNGGAGTSAIGGSEPNVANGYVLGRVETWVLPTVITDRYGNTVTYTYDASLPWRVKTIAGSDGRTLTLEYVGTTGNVVSSVSDGMRTWNYSYNGSKLVQVLQPDNSQWQFSVGALTPGQVPNPTPTCEGTGMAFSPDELGSMVHPSGASLSFTIRTVVHGRSFVPKVCTGGDGTDPGTQYAYHPKFSSNKAIVSKTLSGPGLPAQSWTYSYSDPELNASWDTCTGTCTDVAAVDVSDPRGVLTRYTFGTRFQVNEGKLLKTEVGTAAGGLLKAATTTYRSPDAGPYSPYIGNSFQKRGNGDLAGRFMPANSTVITQQGVNFANQANSFDTQARATSVTKSSSLGYSRTENTSYFDQTAKWVQGQIASVVEPGSGLAMESQTFDADGKVLSKSKFGKVQQKLSYYGDGTVQTVSDDANHTNTFSNYMRGIPQNVSHGDGTASSAIVTNIGTITSVTDPMNSTTGVGYDVMGRMNRIVYPTGDAVAWNDTTIAFEQVGGPEYGLDAGHWRQTISTGNARKVTYFDALWRPRLTRSFDAADPGNSASTVLNRFDIDNRKTFEAYPIRDVGSIDAAVAGKATAFDALGREVNTYADSELGTLTTTTEYLNNFRKRVTNARGYQTTTSYQAFDKPEETAVVAGAMPESVNLDIQRSVFGDTLSITRSGPAVPSGPSSVTRSYVYDQYRRLCKTIEPEIGATVQDYDAAGNIAWKASGIALYDTGSCNRDAVPGASKILYTYDARNRLLGTGYGDGSTPVGRAYYADGSVSAIVSGGSVWTYSYNKRGLLTQENLAYNGVNSSITRTYDANGHENGLGYPDGAYVDFLPNALGQATKVGGYAAGIGYHPNGAVSGYTLGNNVVHTLSQNTRGLPRVNRHSGVVQDQYGYDANGNIGSIEDQQEGVTTRTLGYDGLDRLTTANAPNVWGGGSYSYDGLDNVRTSVIGSRSSVHDYDSANRLSTINTGGIYTGYVFDSRGNVTGRGTQGYYFDQGNRMVLANGVASYTYDGWGRRVSISGGTGDTLQVYSKAGQLLYGTQQGSTNSTTRYISLAGKTIAKTDSVSGTTYLFTDALGSPVASMGNIAATLTYVCPSGWNLAGNQCTQPTSNTQPATISGYNCPAGYTLSGSTCTLTTTSTSAASVSYSCPSGWSLSGSTCSSSSSSPATPVYGCPSGYSLSGSTCTGTSTTQATSSLSCNGYGSLQSYPASPSGYKCTSQVLTISDYADENAAYAQCQSNAASMGLPLVGSQVTNNHKLMTCVMGPVTVYSCPSGGSLSGSTCTSTVTQAASVNSYTCSSGTLSGSNCVTGSSLAATASYSCPNGQTLSGTTCIQTATASSPGTPVYSCPSGWSLAGSICTQQGSSTVAATASYTCPNGGTLSGFTCMGALWRTRYEPFGNTAAGVVPSDIGFTGHVNDVGTGLVYMEQRYYDPIAARFQSLDPVVTDLNTGKSFGRYFYSNNNPYKFIDVDGRDPTDGILKECSGTCQWVVGGPATQIQSDAAKNVANTLQKGIDHVADVGQYVFKSDSVKLAKNMAKYNSEAREKGQHAHHIVAQHADKAKPAQAVLEKAGISINSQLNGVFVDGPRHLAMHTDAYYDAVNAALAGATSPVDVAARLTVIKGLIQGSKFP